MHREDKHAIPISLNKNNRTLVENKDAIIKSIVP